MEYSDTLLICSFTGLIGSSVTKRLCNCSKYAGKDIDIGVKEIEIKKVYLERGTKIYICSPFCHYRRIRKKRRGKTMPCRSLFVSHVQI